MKTIKTLFAGAAFAMLATAISAQEIGGTVTLNSPSPACTNFTDAAAVDISWRGLRNFPATNAFVARRQPECIWLQPGTEYIVLQIRHDGPGERSVALCLRHWASDVFPTKSELQRCYWANFTVPR